MSRNRRGMRQAGGREAGRRTEIRETDRRLFHRAIAVYHVLPTSAMVREIRDEEKDEGDYYEPEEPVNDNWGVD